MWLGNLRLYIAGTPERFATRRGGEDLKQLSLRFPIAEARERGRYAFLPPRQVKGSATLSHPRGKGKQTLRFPTGGENSPPNGVAFLFCLDFVHLEQEQRDLPRCDVQRSCTSRPLLLLIFRAPYEAAGGWREGPAGVAGTEASHFSSGQEPRRKARNPHAYLEGVARKAPIPGGPFFGLLFFTPGILPSALRAGFAVRTRSCACVGRQRKVTRPSAEGRNARCVGGQIAIRHEATTILTATGSRPSPG